MKKRNYTIDFLKFVFSVVIVIFHAKNIILPGEKYMFVGGSIGVDFFFLVSGYFMAASAIKKGYNSQVGLGQDTFEFMKRKIGGLFPNVYVGWIVGFTVYHVVRKTTGAMMLKHAFYSLGELLLINQSGFDEYKANAVGWYLSAMLLTMLIVYPLLRKYKDTFFYILAPIIVIFLWGITYQNFANLRAPNMWIGNLIYKGMIRAIMEITLGALLFKIAAYMQTQKFTALTKGILTFVEVICFGSVLWYCFDHGASKFDWYLVVLLAVGVLISASAISFSPYFFRNKIFSWLGEFSFSLYLGHGYWSHVINEIGYLKNLPYMQKLVVYLVITMITGLFIMYLSKWIKGMWNKKNIRSLFVEV